MKSLLVVGGDKLGNIPEKLEQQGFKEVIHLNGRKSRMVQMNIPRKVEVILILTDSVNHNLSNVIKKKAQEKSIPICYSKRSWYSINKEVQKTMTLIR
ncbi:MAG TPA: DUF2325 domain-containing protein [Bacillus sp. (in: firmicutes)]|nr:DUF2325 domain-containing protein [Bacillus sp. (in: firmicutes)]